MQPARRSVYMLFLLLPAALAIVAAVPAPPALASTFTVGDLYLLTGAHPDPEIYTGILRIVPETGEVTSLGEVDLWPGIFCYDPQRDRLIGRTNGAVMTVDVNGVETPLIEMVGPPWLIEPRGDGILYANWFSTNDFCYIDVSNVIHPLLDGSGEVFTLGNAASPTELHYDLATNSLLVFGGTGDNIPGCPDSTRSCVLQIPLTADGTGVAGAVTTTQVEISSTWEIPVGAGRVPGGGVLWVADTNSNDREPRMQLLDPVSMTSVPYASNGPYTGAAATNAGEFSSRLGRAVILDTYRNFLRAFGSGEVGGGTVVAESLSASGSGETARLVEIWTSPLLTDVARPVPARPALAAAPNPFRAGTQLSVQLAGSARVTLSIHDVAGRLVRLLADESFAAGTHAFDWDGRDARGRPVAPGIYFARLDRDGMPEMRKLVLQR